MLYIKFVYTFYIVLTMLKDGSNQEKNWRVSIYFYVSTFAFLMWLDLDLDYCTILFLSYYVHLTKLYYITWYSIKYTRKSKTITQYYLSKHMIILCLSTFLLHTDLSICLCHTCNYSIAMCSDLTMLKKYICKYAIINY